LAIVCAISGFQLHLEVFDNHGNTAPLEQQNSGAGSGVLDQFSKLFEFVWFFWHKALVTDLEVVRRSQHGTKLWDHNDAS
jgi:hypothetical protein